MLVSVSCGKATATLSELTDTEDALAKKEDDVACSAAPSWSTAAFPNSCLLLGASASRTEKRTLRHLRGTRQVQTGQEANELRGPYAGEGRRIARKIRQQQARGRRREAKAHRG